MTEQERNELLQFMEEYNLKMETDDKLKTELLQGIGLIDENGEKTERYYRLQLYFSQLESAGTAV
jgi:hypothetical protein